MEEEVGHVFPPFGGARLDCHIEPAQRFLRVHGVRRGRQGYAPQPRLRQPGVQPAELVPDGSSLAELLDEVYLEEVPLFNRRLEFFQMPKTTGKGKTVEQFVELLEARAREAEVHLMTREDLIMLRCHTGVVEEGMLTEWRRLENPTLNDMKRALTRYKAGKAQKKALKKDRDRYRDSRAARVRDKEPSGGGGDKRKRSPSRRAVPPEWRELAVPPLQGQGARVVYAIQKCAFYIMGATKPFTVVTDHKPLLGMFNKPLSETPNPRLQRLRLKVVEANVRLA